MKKISLIILFVFLASVLFAQTSKTAVKTDKSDTKAKMDKSDTKTKMDKSDTNKKADKSDMKKKTDKSDAKKIAKVLTKAYVESFIKNYAAIETDLSTLNIDMNAPGSPAVMMKALEAQTSYKQMSDILKKYGLGNNGVEAYVTIGYCYIIITLEEGYKNLDKSDMLTKTSKEQYKKLIDSYKKNVNEEDLELVKKYKNKLDNAIMSFSVTEIIQVEEY